MTAPTPADVPGQGEVEGLADRLDRWERGLDGANETDAWQNRLARAILASDWLAERDAEVARAAKAEALFGFTQWVASNRAYNGSEHRHGQSLYNECLNGVLHVWASDYLRTEPRP